MRLPLRRAMGRSSLGPGLDGKEISGGEHESVGCCGGRLE